MAIDYISLEATVLSPFHYHGLYQPDGSATIAEWISDTSVVFALSHALGQPPTRLPRLQPCYKTDLERIPWRASLFHGTPSTRQQVPAASYPHLLPPSRRAILVEREGAYTHTVIDNMKKGPYKRSWFVQEVAPGSTYHGLLVSSSELLAVLARSLTAHPLCIRIGVGRQGLVQLTHLSTAPARVYLNTATLQLFGQPVPEHSRPLDTLRISFPMPPQEAADLLTQTLPVAACDT